jgi:hypothetical protein
MTVAWGPLLVDQLTFYWDTHLRPRLDGLTDEEYLWEPVANCWNLRVAPDGTVSQDDMWPPPEPAPITTIAWRMAHIAVGCFADRAQLFFDVPGDDPLPGTAAEGIAFLEDTYHRWHDRIAALDEAGFARPLGRRGGPYAKDPMGALIAHINREVMHHGAEVCLLRDLYRAGFATGR